MALEPKENQFKWFVKLVETQGLEAANKYTEILRQVPLTLEQTTMNQKVTMNMSQPKNVTPNTDIAFDSLLGGPSPALNELLGVKDATNLIDTNAFTMISANAINRNADRSLLMANDLMGSHADAKPSSSSMLHGVQQHHHQQQQPQQQ